MHSKRNGQVTLLQALLWGRWRAGRMQLSSALQSGVDFGSPSWVAASQEPHLLMLKPQLGSSSHSASQTPVLLLTCQAGFSITVFEICSGGPNKSINATSWAGGNGSCETSLVIIGETTGFGKLKPAKTKHMYHHPNIWQNRIQSKSNQKRQRTFHSNEESNSSSRHHNPKHMCTELLVYLIS